MAHRIGFFIIVGLFYFPMVLHVPIIELDPSWMIEDTSMRVILTIFFIIGVLFFDGKGTPNSPVGGY